jgi:hypothetical protein
MEIEGYENYLIYDDGRVYSKMTNKFLKPTLNSSYYNVTLCKKGNPRSIIRIHRLVGLHYLDKIEGKDYIDHIDRNKTNNHVSNLRWCNNSENMRNTNTYITNKLGYKHIFKTKSNTYRFTIKRDKQHTKCFKTLEECIEYRDNYLANIN